MKIQNFSFGSIRIDGTVHDDDVVIDGGVTRKRGVPWPIFAPARTDTKVMQGELDSPFDFPTQRQSSRGTFEQKLSVRWTALRFMAVLCAGIRLSGLVAVLRAAAAAEHSFQISLKHRVTRLPSRNVVPFASACPGLSGLYGTMRSK
jgi:hypothetical protein